MGLRNHHVIAARIVACLSPFRTPEEMEDVEDVPSRPSSHEASQLVRLCAGAGIRLGGCCFASDTVQQLQEPEPAAAKQLPSLKRPDMNVIPVALPSHQPPTLDRLKRFTGVQTPDWTSGATKNLIPGQFKGFLAAWLT